MYVQKKTLLNVMNNSRIKNTVAYLKNSLESRNLKKTWTRMFVIYSMGPNSEAEFFLSNVEVVLSFLPQIQIPV